MKTLFVKATGYPVPMERSRRQVRDGRDQHAIHADEPREVPATAYYLAALRDGLLTEVERPAPRTRRKAETD